MGREGQLSGEPRQQDEWGQGPAALTPESLILSGEKGEESSFLLILHTMILKKLMFST